MGNNPFSSYDMDYISSLNNAYRDASVRGGTNAVPEGKYQAALSYIALLPSKYFENELQLCLGFTILEGDQKGASLSKYISIIPESMERLKTDMTVLGLDLENNIVKLGEQDVLEGLLDTVVDLTVRHKQKKDGKGWYTNIYLNRASGKYEGDLEVQDDDNPFA